MPALVRYEALKAALAEALTVDEVKEIRNKWEALRAYARMANDEQLELDAGEYRVRAERRLGELIKAQGDAGLLAKPTGSNQYKEVDRVAEKPEAITLAQAGIDKNLANRARKLAAMPEEVFEAGIKRVRDRVGAGKRVSIDIIKEQADAKRKAEHAERTYTGGKVGDLLALAASGFKASTILADPPWHFMARSDKGEGRSAAQHYTTDRSWQDIISLPVAQLAAPDCVLLMWMVDWCPKLALEVIEAWGFAHKTTAFTWAKQNGSGEGWHMGQGYWTRANPEACWLATRGHPKRIHADVRQLIVHPVMEHSRKPDEIHDRIERLLGGPYLELYARRERNGWVTWGNELEFKIPVVDDSGATIPHNPDTGEVIETEATPIPGSGVTDDRSGNHSASLDSNHGGHP